MSFSPVRYYQDDKLTTKDGPWEIELLNNNTKFSRENKFQLGSVGKVPSKTALFKHGPRITPFSLET